MPAKIEQENPTILTSIMKRHRDIDDGTAIPALGHGRIDRMTHVERALGINIHDGFEAPRRETLRLREEIPSRSIHEYVDPAELRHRVLHHGLPGRRKKEMRYIHSQ